MARKKFDSPKAGAETSVLGLARGPERGEEGRGRPARPSPGDPQTLGFRCSKTLAMALMSSSPQPLAQPRR
jgi:hypothetical protein